MDSNDFRWIQVDEQVTLALTVEAVRKAADAEPVAVMCGADTGIKAPGVRLHWGIKLSGNRSTLKRKKLMN